MGLNTSTKNSFIFLGLLLFISCSTQDVSWVNRNLNALGTRYNVLFNGKLALKQGKQELVQDYFDNYWEILPVERMQILGLTEMSTEETRNSNFIRAEEKATKAIQKYSVLIDGVQHNPQMDEAFLLLGKSRYFDQRFVPALSSFNYILDHQQDSATVVPAIIWKAKTQLRMEYPELALQNLKELLGKEVKIKRQEHVGLSATMAQAYINLGQEDSAIVHISRAAEFVKDKEKRGRYLYIKGQLYDKLGMKDSANVAFDEIIALKRKTPRVYRIHAFLEKIKNFDFENGDRVAMLEMLDQLAEKRENRAFLGYIYYQTAEYYHGIDSTDLAVDYYNKSLGEDSWDTYLNSRNYLTLGNINFDRAQYKEAGAYYDSTLAHISEYSREYRILKNKRDNLDDVILYESIAVENDSILNLVAMSAPERLVYFEEYTQQIKKQAIEEALAKFEANKRANQNAGANEFFQNKNTTTGDKQVAEEFYFYKPTQVAYGKLAFEKKWGDRSLQDNWRTDGGGIEKQATQKEEEEELTKKSILAALNSDPQYDPETYISKIPTEIKVIDSLKEERNFAYYQLGLIYKEQFKEYDLASEKLEQLLENNPDQRLVLPAKYNLYKIYSITGQTAKADQWKRNILNNHPDSRYATIILNPTKYKLGKNSPESVYNRLYEKYLAQKFQLVIDSSNAYVTQFNGDPIVPKLELLKATAIGRLQGFEAYKEALNFVALNYPLSEEGEKAQKLYTEAIPAMANKDFKENTKEDEHHLVYVFFQSEIEAAKQLKEKLDKAIVEKRLPGLTTSIDVYNAEKLFVVVHGLNSRFQTMRFGRSLHKKRYDIKKDFFDISSINYKIILIHKNLSAYLQL